MVKPGETHDQLYVIAFVAFAFIWNVSGAQLSGRIYCGLTIVGGRMDSVSVIVVSPQG